MQVCLSTLHNAPLRSRKSLISFVFLRTNHFENMMKSVKTYSLCIKYFKSGINLFYLLPCASVPTTRKMFLSRKILEVRKPRVHILFTAQIWCFVNKPQRPFIVAFRRSVSFCFGEIVEGQGHVLFIVPVWSFVLGFMPTSGQCRPKMIT